MDKKVAIVLGGTAVHRELIIRLKEMGYSTLLVDYLENPPARNVADCFLRESTMSKEKVLEIARDNHAFTIISGCVDQANITACYVSEQLGLYTPYSYDSAIKITNKAYMKKVMFERDILTSRYLSINSLAELDNIQLRFPVMVKPADSNSANGVKKAYNPNEMKESLLSALNISRNHKAIVEEFVEGREFSAYCLIKEGTAHLLMTNERISVIEGEDKVIKCFASIAPARLSQDMEIRAENVATKLANAFGLNNTLFFYQGILSDDGEISVIEFAPRVGGGVCFRTIQLNTGFDVLDSIIRLSIGESVSLDNWHRSTGLLTVNTVYARNCVLDHVNGFQKLKDEHIIEDYFMYKTSGMRIDNRSASGGRIGAFIMRSDNESVIPNDVKKAYSELSVIDSHGENVIRGDLNLFAKKEMWLKEYEE